MTKNVLVSNLMMLNERERFEGILLENGVKPIFPNVSQFLKKEECMSYAGQIDGWLAGDDVIDFDVLQAMLPRLKIISKWGTGLDSIDLQSAQNLDVKVTNTTGAFGEAVGELAVGYILSLTRQIHMTHSEVANGSWPKCRHKSLSQQSVGIVGYGAIGQGVAERLSPFGCKLFFVDPNVSACPKGFANPCALPEMRFHCDIIVLCCNLTDENHHMVGEAFLQNLEKVKYIINVSRGGLLDEDALITALKSGRLVGAALDVYENEPCNRQQDFAPLNIIFGSHNANNTEAAVEYVHTNTLKNLLDNL